jgi:hypothetical protein
MRHFLLFLAVICSLFSICFEVSFCLSFSFSFQDELAGSNDVVRGCNYHQMSQLIDALADEMEKIPPNRAGPSSGSLTALLRNTISTPAMSLSEPTVNLPPVPHSVSSASVHPHPELPAVAGDIAPATHHHNKQSFEIPQHQPQAVPQFVPLETPSFGTLQFGEGFSSSSAASNQAGGSNGRLEYATINFQAEPFFPPSSTGSSALHHHVPHHQPSISHPPPQPASSLPQLSHHQPHHATTTAAHHHHHPEPVAPVVQHQTHHHHEEPKDASAHHHATTTTAVHHEKEEPPVLAAPGSTEKPQQPQKEGSPKSARNRERRNRNKLNRENSTDNKEGGAEHPQGAEGAEKKPSRSAQRRKFDQEKEGAISSPVAPDQEGEGAKQPYKKRSYRFDRTKAETGEFQEGSKESTSGKGEHPHGTHQKEYNYTKKFNKDNKRSSPTAAESREHQKKEGGESSAAHHAVEEHHKPAATAAPTADHHHQQPPAAAAAVHVPAPAKPVAVAAETKPVETKPVEVKRSSYQDALRAHLTTSEPAAAEKTTDNKPKKTHTASATAEPTAEGKDRAPRRDRSNNRVPRDRENNSNNNNNTDGQKPRPPVNNNNQPNNNNKQGGERKNTNENKPRPSSNNNNNASNNRTVNNQTVRKPAGAKSEQTNA